MATITQDLGKVAYLSKGAYNSSTQYEKNDVVTYQGSSYVSLQSTQGNAPTNATYWQLLASKGDTGATGETGQTGATGNGILSITKTSTSGLVDTYTITYTNGNTTTFEVTNGEDNISDVQLNGTSILSEGIANITGVELLANKVTSIDENSTDTQYPSAKCVYDLVGDIESILETLDVGSGVE